MRPTYIIIGTQKGGTTSMKFHFRKHPDIDIRKGEIHFFDKNYFFDNNKCDISIYEKNFETNKTIIGEKTPSYMYIRSIIDRIQLYYPDIKLIILLREPIQRAYSQYNMNKKRDSFCEAFIDLIKGTEHIKVEDILENNSRSYYLQRGMYIDQLEYIYSKFPAENIHICISEEIIENPLEEYNKVFQFLGATPLNSLTFDKDINMGIYKSELSQDDRVYLYNLYKPYNERLYKFLGRKIDSWEIYYKKYNL